MRIAYELTALQLDKGGTARAIEQTLPLLERDPDLEIVRLSHEGDVPTSGLGVLVRGLARELWYLPRVLPEKVKQSGADLLHCPSQLGPIDCDVPFIITLHDAIGWDHPEWLTRANVLQLRRRTTRMVAAGAHVITSSEYSRQRLLEVFGVDPERISVVPLGLDPRFTPAPNSGDEVSIDALGIRGPFIFTVGTLQPRKNLGAAISAFERLEGAEQHQLVIAGARGWRDDELMRRIESSPARDRIKLLGRVGDDQLIALYRSAACFVFPSRYEGFGFPPLEAMACGTPVLSTRLTSLAEVVGDAAVELDADRPDQIADAIEHVLGSELVRASLVERGLRRAERYTWSSTAAETRAVYERVLGSSGGGCESDH